MYNYGATISPHNPLNMCIYMYKRGETELMLQWLLTVDSFPGNSQIVFAGVAWEWGVQLEHLVTVRPAIELQDQHIFHIYHCDEIYRHSVLPFIFHNGAKWNHSFKLEEKEWATIRYHSSLYTPVHYHTTVSPYMYTSQVCTVTRAQDSNNINGNKQAWYYDNDFIIWIIARLDVAASDF